MTTLCDNWLNRLTIAFSAYKNLMLLVCQHVFSLYRHRHFTNYNNRCTIPCIFVIEYKFKIIHHIYIQNKSFKHIFEFFESILSLLFLILLVFGILLLVWI